MTGVRFVAARRITGNDRTWGTLEATQYYRLRRLKGKWVFENPALEISCEYLRKNGYIH